MSEPNVTGPGLHGALVRNTGYLISRLGVLAAQHFSERIESLGLTTRMWGALNVVDAEPAISQHQLGRLIGTDPSTMVSTIDELESRGMVERRPHPSDRRVHALHITADGRETLERGRSVARAAQNELLAPLSAIERHELHGLLLRLLQASGETGPDAAER